MPTPFIRERDWIAAATSPEASEDILRRIGALKATGSDATSKTMALAAVITSIIQDRDAQIAMALKNLNPFQKIMLSKQGGLSAAQRRTEFIDPNMFKNEGVEIIGDNLAQEIPPLMQLPILPSVSQFEKVRALPLRDRKSLKLVRVLPENRPVELVRDNLTITGNNRLPDFGFIEKIPGVDRAYYELVAGVHPHSTNKSYAHGIQILKEDQFITSAQAAIIARIAEIKAGKPANQGIFPTTARIADIHSYMLVLAENGVSETSTEEQRPNLGIAYSIE